MTDAVQEFLDKIGPRKLTEEEARALRLLKLRAGLAPDDSGLLDKMSEKLAAQKKDGDAQD
ncbi:MAG: hypothetical protein GC185_12010 [Alphaproteobacteria bacterium]|nr:hypothetical protein [Alphaproteobacteria bacterium]